MKKALKIFLSIFCIFIISIYLVIITAPGSYLIKKIIQEQLSSAIESPVKIGSLRTNLFSDVQVNHVVVGVTSSQRSPVMAFDKLRIRYDLGGLFYKKIILKNIQLDNLHTAIERDSVGHFNFYENLFGNGKDSLSRTSESSNGYQIKIGRLKISNMRFSYSDQKESIGVILDKINLNVYSEQSKKNFSGDLHVETGSLRWRRLSQQVHQLEAKFGFDKDKFELANLVFKTDALELESSTGYHFDSHLIQSGIIQSRLDLGVLNQLEIGENKTRYEGDLSIRCDFEGKIDRPEVKISLSLDRGVFHEIPIDHFNADLLLQNQTLKLNDLSLEALAGNIQATGDLSYPSDSLQYTVDVSLGNFQLSELLSRLYPARSDGLDGILDGKFSIDGCGADWGQMTANGKIDLLRMSIHSQLVNDIHANFSFTERKLNFNFLQDGSQINLISTINSDSTITGEFEGNLSNVETLASLANIPGLNGKLKFSGDLNGNLSSPAVNMNFHFGEGGFRGFPLTNIEGGIYLKNRQLGVSNLVATGTTSDLLPIARSFAIDSLAGVFSYHLTADGNFDKLAATAKISWDEAKINHANFDNLVLILNASGRDIFIDSLIINKQDASLSGSGQVNWQDGLLADLKFNFMGIDSSHQTISNQGLIRFTGNLNNDELGAEIHGKDINLAPLAKLLLFEEAVTGILDFEGKVFGTYNRPDFSLAWNLVNPIFRNKSLNSIFGELKYEDQSLSISKIMAIKNDGIFNLSGELPIDLYQQRLSKSKKSLIQIQAEAFDLNFLEALLPDSMSIEGKLTTKLQYQGDLDDPWLEGKLHIDRASVKIPDFSNVDSMEVNSNFLGQQFRLERLAGKISRFHFNFQGAAHFENQNLFDATFFGNIPQIGQIRMLANRQLDQSLRSQLKIEKLNLANLSQIAPINLQIAGLVDIAIDVAGTESSPLVSLQMNSDQIKIEKAQIDSLHFAAFYKDDLINIDESGFKIGDGKIFIKGDIPFSFAATDSSAQSVPNMHIESFASDLNVDWLRPFIPGITTLQGKANYTLSVSGSFDNPLIDGSFSLQNGILKLKDLNPGINDINVNLAFSDDRVTIKDISGKVETGSFIISGKADIKNRKLEGTEANLLLEKIKLTSPEIISIDVEQGDIKLTQEEDKFKLKGRIKLTEVKYIQDFKLQISQFLTQIPNRPQPEINAALNKIFLDIILQGQENIWIENNLAQLQMTSNLNLVGTLAQPNISGRLVVNKGYVLYLDRKFKITTGTIDFSDPYRINPNIDVIAECAVTDYQNIKETKYTITLKLSGLLEKPELSLVSNPTLDKADIVAVLTVGRTREHLLPQSKNDQTSSFQQIMLDRAKEITSQRIASMTEQQLSRTLALEDISIEGNLFQLDKDWGPRVTATKQLSDKIKVTYSTVVGHANEQQIKLGYQLVKNLYIIGSSNQRGESGLDLKLNIKFY